MIYLDNASTTQIDPLVVEAMMPYLTEQFGNPGSLHKLGRDAKEAIETARKQVAEFMSASPEQIVFTSGATESNNMVFEMARTVLERLEKKHIVTTKIEHKSVLRSVQRLEEQHGFAVTYLDLSEKLSPFPQNFSQSVCGDTGLVSMMYVNNEISHAFAVHAIGNYCVTRGILFHTDCVQAACCRPIQVDRIGCDFATISSHKIHGPKGVGALFVKNPSMWSPMILGGASQEHGLRGGTENVAGIVGFGKACELYGKQQSDRDADRFESMKSIFWDTLVVRLESRGFGDILHINGGSRFATRTLSIRADGVDAQSLVLAAGSAGVCISAGSACDSSESTPSHVLEAIGLSPDQARNSFRVSFSRMNTVEEAARGARIIADCILDLVTMHG